MAKEHAESELQYHSPLRYDAAKFALEKFKRKRNAEREKIIFSYMHIWETRTQTPREMWNYSKSLCRQFNISFKKSLLNTSYFELNNSNNSSKYKIECLYLFGVP